MLIKELERTHKNTRFQIVNLAKTSYSASMAKKLAKADAVLCVTGTYWDSWGSPLQKFLEDATELEVSPAILGKPMGVCVLMHSVGGKSILSRLQGVFSSMGFLIPPLSGMAYSLSGQLAMSTHNKHAQDFWHLNDLNVILENLKLAAQSKTEWNTWPVDRINFRKKWIKADR